MPNHIENALTVFGPARDVATFVMRSCEKRPWTGDAPESLNYQVSRGNQKPTVFDFHGVVPLPALYSAVPYDSGREGGPCGYDMEQKTWGQKWGPYRVQTPEVQEHMVTYRYTTAWGVAQAYYLSASLAFPQCTLALSYGGEGPMWGRRIYQQGKEVSRVEGDYKTLPDAQTDEDAERSDVIVAEYLTSHDEWIATLIHGEEA